MSAERILIVDDEANVLELCARILSAEGYQVATASNAHQAIEMARTGRYDFLLTDIKMPGIDGLEMTRAIQKACPGIVCVAMTGYSSLDMAIQALKLGMADFILKPFAPAELAQAVNRALENERLRRENARLQALIPLFELNKTMMGTMEREELLRRVAQTSHQATQADWTTVVVRLAEHPGREGWMLAHYPLRASLPAETTLWAGVYSQLPSFSPVILSSPQEYGGRFATCMAETRSQALILAPLAVKGQPIGLLSVGRGAGKSPFTTSDVELLTVLAGQAAIAIENARLFEEIQRAYEELQYLDRMKSQFINIAAHELRTPLAILLGYVSLLEEEARPETREWIRIIARNAIRLRSLIDDMLSLHHLETGEVQIRLEKVELSDLIEDVVADFRPLIEAGQQKLQIDLANLPPVTTDRQKLALVISNLLSNAVKFTPAGGRITIRAWPDSLDESKVPRFLRFSVSDTGRGIPPEERERIFNRFYQIEDALTREHGGLGLGLAIARGTVERLGGRIWVESTVGEGSTFYFTIPIGEPV